MVIIKTKLQEPGLLAAQYGYLPYMVQRYMNFLGVEETIKLLKANEQPLSKWIRTNTLKITSNALAKRLQDKGFTLKPTSWLPYAFEVIKEPFNIGALHEYLQNRHFQEIASRGQQICPRPAVP